ncbi:alpha/beta fold hydrolase [Microbacterium sp. ZW T5_56]|uniref:alpha/beta fold hydrolase n=1 Tax=Microbacterium sp. ZW T5_56 TaxID=3378081 RepID=UPI0038543C5E
MELARLANGSSIAFERVGDAAGEPVIVLPGGPCRGPEYIGDLAGLGDVRPLIVVHFRGTTASADASPGWWLESDAVIAILDHLGLDEADILGHSAGTRVALATMTRHPGRIRRAALVTPAASWLTGTQHDIAEIAARRADPIIDHALTAPTDLPDTEAEFQGVLQQEAPLGYAHWTALEQQHARVGTTTRAATLGWFSTIPDDAPAQILAADLPPLLVVAAAEDMLSGVRPTLAYAEALGAKQAWIADCGHYPWIERPEEFRTILNGWMTQG